MEQLGKSFILVIEPLEFNVYEKKIAVNLEGSHIPTTRSEDLSQRVTGKPPSGFAYSL